MRNLPKPFHQYNVKDTLTEYCGNFAISYLRQMTVGWMEDTSERSKLLPAVWAYADHTIRKNFNRHIFLKETILFDDYIAYLTQNGPRKIAFLLFVKAPGPDPKPFNINPDYAHPITEQWKKEGYEVVFVCALVDFENRRDEMRIVPARSSSLVLAQSVSTYNPYYHGDNERFCKIMCNPVSPSVRKVAAHLKGALERRDKEFLGLLLAEDVAFYQRGDDDKDQLICEGKKAISDLLLQTTLQQCYLREPSHQFHSFALSDGRTPYLIYTDENGKISEICKLNETTIYKALFDVAEQPIPKLTAISVQDPIIQHGFTIRGTFSNGTVKSFSLFLPDSIELPATFTYKGIPFTRKDFYSARLMDSFCEGILFQNGCFISHEEFYFNGVSQQKILEKEELIFENEEFALYQICSHPRMQTPDGIYEFLPAPCGPDGKRLTDCLDITLHSAKQPFRTAFRNGKEGILHPNGQWAAPPVYDAVRICDDGCSVLKRDGEIYLLTANQKLVPLGLTLEHWDFCYHYIPFYFKSNRLYGYLDRSGSVAISPKFAVAQPFCKQNYAIIGVLQDNRILYGTIGMAGEEIIPPRFHALEALKEGVLAYQDDRKKWGILNPQGDILMKARFEYIGCYDPVHQLVSAGTEDDVSVYSIHKEQPLLPLTYDFIEFEPNCILGYFNYETFCFDYNGNPISEEEVFFENDDETPPLEKNPLQINAEATGLYTRDRTPVLTGTFKNIAISEPFISAETPFEKAYYEIRHKNPAKELAPFLIEQIDNLKNR